MIDVTTSGQRSKTHKELRITHVRQSTTEACSKSYDAREPFLESPARHFNYLECPENEGALVGRTPSAHQSNPTSNKAHAKVAKIKPA